MVSDFHCRRKSTYSHRDSHVSFGYGVHRRANEGGVEGDVAGNLGLEVDIAGRELDPPRQEKEIIVGEATVNFRIHEILDGEAILVLVLLEELQRLRGWEMILSGHLCT